MFRKSDYIPFGLGIFIFGGLFLVPLFWSKFNHIDFEDAILPSIISCLVFFIAHDNRGNFSFGRFIMGFVFVYFTIMRTSMKYGSGSKMFLAGGFLGYLVMFACGWAGIMLGRLVRGKEQLEREIAAEQQAIVEQKAVELQQKKSEPDSFSDLALIAKQNTPYHKFMAVTYCAWRNGNLQLLSEVFKKEAAANTFEKFCSGHEQYKKDIEESFAMRPFEDGEFLVALTPQWFIMTSKVIYIFKPEKKIINIKDIADYKVDGVLGVNMNLTLKSGEKLVFPKMKAAPAEKFVFAFRDGKIS
jgi:hypothetical protein